MRKLIVDVAVSLDGYIEGPNGEYDWCFNDQDYGLTDFVNSIDAIFYGRKSYELFGRTIPESVSQGKERELWEFVLSKKKYVFSTTLTELLNENTILINRNIEEEVKRIKKENGKNIWLYGGASLVTSLINLGLVDELRLAVHPIILGAGNPLFKNMMKSHRLELTEMKSYSTGLVLLQYCFGKHH